MELQEAFNLKIKQLRTTLPDLSHQPFPDDAIVQAIHQLFPEALISCVESPEFPRPGVTRTMQYSVSWEGFTFTVTRQII